jgi:hypothetical protein
MPRTRPEMNGQRQRKSVLYEKFRLKLGPRARRQNSFWVDLDNVKPCLSTLAHVTPLASERQVKAPCCHSVP